MWLGISRPSRGAIATFELKRLLRELVLIWWAIVVTFTAAASLLIYAYHRSADKVASAPQWLRWLGIAALGNGASWGLAGGVFFRSLSEGQQVFLAFLFAGMASVGIPVYAASWPIFALYAAGILGPFFNPAHVRQPLFVEIALMPAVLRDQRGALRRRRCSIPATGATPRKRPRTTAS
jgi:hypothetical protein